MRTSACPVKAMECAQLAPTLYSAALARVARWIDGFVSLALGEKTAPLALSRVYAADMYKERGCRSCCSRFFLSRARATKSLGLLTRHHAASERLSGIYFSLYILYLRARILSNETTTAMFYLDDDDNCWLMARLRARTEISSRTRERRFIYTHTRERAFRFEQTTYIRTVGIYE